MKKPDKNRPPGETPPPDDLIPFGKRKISREELQKELKALAQKELEALGMNVPTVETPPVDSCRPDGSPWLTKEQILEKLDRTLGIRDKVRIQRMSKEDAEKCMLCWLAQELDDDVEPFDRHKTVSGGTGRGPVYRRNPNIPLEKVIRPCFGRHCEEKALEHFSGFGDWMPKDGSYDLALAYWKRLEEQPKIEIEDEPPKWPDSKTETWIRFEKTDRGFKKVVLAPAATRCVEWRMKYTNEKLDEFLDETAVERWFASLTNVHRLSAQIQCLGCEKEPDKRVSAEVELQNDDGGTTCISGVPIPNVARWIAKKYEFWKMRWRYVCCISSLFEWEGTPERLEQVDSFERARKLIEAYLMSGKLLPMDEIRQLHEEWDEIEVNVREQTAVDYAVEHGMIEIPKQILERFFPKRMPK